MWFFCADNRVLGKREREIASSVNHVHVDALYSDNGRRIFHGREGPELRTPEAWASTAVVDERPPSE
jgi:hypothetical protein